MQNPCYTVRKACEEDAAGIDKALLQQAEDTLKRDGFSTVSLWVLEGNTKAQAFL